MACRIANSEQKWRNQIAVCSDFLSFVNQRRAMSAG